MRNILLLSHDKQLNYFNMIFLLISDKIIFIIVFVMMITIWVIMISSKKRKMGKEELKCLVKK